MAEAVVQVDNPQNHKIVEVAGLPPGWYAIEKTYLSGKLAGSTYMRFFSKDNKFKNILTVPQAVRLHAKDNGEDPEAAVAALAAARAKKAKDKLRGLVEQEAVLKLRRNEAIEKYREKCGMLMAKEVEQTESWKIKRTLMENCGQTRTEYHSPVEGSGIFRLLIDIEAYIGDLLIQGALNKAIAEDGKTSFASLSQAAAEGLSLEENERALITCRFRPGRGQFSALDERKADGTEQAGSGSGSTTVAKPKPVRKLAAGAASAGKVKQAASAAATRKAKRVEDDAVVVDAGSDDYIKWRDDAVKVYRYRCGKLTSREASELPGWRTQVVLPKSGQANTTLTKYTSPCGVTFTYLVDIEAHLGDVLSRPEIEAKVEREQPKDTAALHAVLAAASVNETSNPVKLRNKAVHIARCRGAPLGGHPVRLPEGVVDLTGSGDEDDGGGAPEPPPSAPKRRRVTGKVAQAAPPSSPAARAASAAASGSAASAAAGAQDDLGADFVSLTVARLADASEVTMQIRRTTPIKKLMKTYAKHIGVDMESLRFTINDAFGIAPEQTAEDLDLRDGDLLECWED